MQPRRPSTHPDHPALADKAGPDPRAVDDDFGSVSREREYAVGYGKPPTGNRFQPGRSGNPQGRPRGDLAFKTLLRRELDTRVPVKEGGRRRKLSKRGIIVKRLVSEAMAGSPKHLALVLAQDPIAAEVLDAVTAALTRPADDAVKADLIERLRAAAAGQGPSTDQSEVIEPSPVEPDPQGGVA